MTNRKGLERNCQLCEAAFYPWDENSLYCSRGCATWDRVIWQVHHLLARGHTKEAKEKMGNANRGRKSKKKGKTYEEIYGEERATSLKQKLSDAHEGQIPWIKGKKHSEKSKQQTSRNRRGKNIGPDHHNWKGGLAHRYGRIYEMQTSEYKDWREAVFKRDNYTCQDCRVRGGDLQADHILPWATFPDKRLDINNGRTLCVPCHRKTPTYGTKALLFTPEVTQ